MIMGGAWIKVKFEEASLLMTHGRGLGVSLDSPLEYKSFISRKRPSAQL